MRNSSSGVPPIHNHLNTAVHLHGSVVLPSAHRKGLKHAFYYIVQSQKRKTGGLFLPLLAESLCCLVRDPEAKGGGQS